MNFKNYSRKVLYTLKKYRPQILTGIGVAGTVAGVVSACMATKKVDEVIDQHNDNIDQINCNAIAVNDEKKTNKELTNEYLRFAWDMTKLYGPSVLMICGAIACNVSSTVELTNRNSGLAAALLAERAINTTIIDRIKEKYGDDAVAEIKNGLVKKKTKKTKDNPSEEYYEKTDETKANDFSFFFDEASRYYNKNANANLNFIIQTERALNRQLKTSRDGLLSLADVCKALDIPRTKVSTWVGWKYDPNGAHDENGIPMQVRLGWTKIYDLASGNFINGNEYDATFLLEPNVEGPLF